jgi:hypothetical protein
MRVLVGPTGVISRIPRSSAISEKRQQATRRTGQAKRERGFSWNFKTLGSAIANLILRAEATRA